MPPFTTRTCIVLPGGLLMGRVDTKELALALSTRLLCHLFNGSNDLDEKAEIFGSIVRNCVALGLEMGKCYEPPE